MLKRRIKKLSIIICTLISVQLLFNEALVLAKIPFYKFYGYSFLCILGYWVHTHIAKKWYDDIYGILTVKELPIPSLVKEVSFILKEMSFAFYILAIGISADTDIILLRKTEGIINPEFLFMGICFLIGSVLLPLIYMMFLLPVFLLLRLIPLYYAPRNYSTFKELEDIKRIWKTLGFLKD